MSNPTLSHEVRDAFVGDLMTARRAAKTAQDRIGEEAAREAVDRAKHVLGEQGPVWWDDAAPDNNRHLAKNTPYAEWFADLLEDRAAACCSGSSKNE